MQYKKIVSCVVGAALAVSTLASLPPIAGTKAAAAPAAKKVTKGAVINTKASKGAKPGEIKVRRGQAKGAMPAPPSKGGHSKAPFSVVHVDNRSGSAIDVYIDRQYRGTVGPWGDLYVYVEDGETRLFAEVPGSGNYGPEIIDLEGDFTWHLNG